jgi:hypothetical protein
MACGFIWLSEKHTTFQPAWQEIVGFSYRAPEPSQRRYIPVMHCIICDLRSGWIRGRSGRACVRRPGPNWGSEALCEQGASLGGACLDDGKLVMKGETSSKLESLPQAGIQPLTCFRQLWASLKPSTSRILRFDKGASYSSISRVTGVFGATRLSASLVGILSVIVSFVALKT